MSQVIQPHVPALNIARGITASLQAGPRVGRYAWLLTGDPVTEQHIRDTAQHRGGGVAFNTHTHTHSISEMHTHISKQYLRDWSIPGTSAINTGVVSQGIAFCCTRCCLITALIFYCHCLSRQCVVSELSFNAVGFNTRIPISHLILIWHHCDMNNI